MQGVVLSDGADLDGYDIIYVDFDNGVDYIQRNAYLLERVIRWVNANKTGTQPNAMIAMSMGGLIAQYALCDIERDPANAAYPHQVGLLITHDSPHQGANIPLGVQMAVRHLAGTVIRNPIGSNIALVDRLPALGQARQALESPAAQQLLRYHALQLSSGGYASHGSAVAGLNSLYVTFQQEYQALLTLRGGAPSGTPGLPCRVVASSNGSECGQGQPYNPGDELAGINTTQNVANFPLLNGFLAVGTIVTGAGAAVYGAGLLGPVGIGVTVAAAGVLSVFALGMTGAYDLTLDFHIHALPDQQEQGIYSIFAQVNKRTRLFGLFRVQFGLLDFQAKSNAAMLPLDTGSGGIISLADYAQSAGGALPGGIVKQQQFAFVPTYSALNITPGGSAALRATYSPGTSVGTPFANFRTAARENEGHLTYTALNSTWMLRELRQNPLVLNCAAFCQAVPTISGASGTDAICVNVGRTLSVNLPLNTTVNWDVQPGGLTTDTRTGNSITLLPVSATTSGRVRITATVVGECGQFALSPVTVTVGIPEVPATRGPNWGNDCGFVPVECRIDNYDAQASYTIAVTGDLVLRNPGINAVDGTYVVSSLTNGGTGYIALTAANSCGTSGTRTLTVTTPCGSGMRAVAARATLYPNPATSSVDVHLDNADAAHPVTVRLFDGYGRPCAEQASRGEATLRLRTGHLPAGLYYVHLLQGGRVVKREPLQLEK